MSESITATVSGDKGEEMEIDQMTRQTGIARSLVSLAATVLAIWGLEPAEAALPELNRTLVETRLQAAGYSLNSPERIREAMKDHDYSVRTQAIRLLAAREGQAAIEGIRPSLQDERREVRIMAARVLAKLGDQSAIKQMETDWARLMPGRRAKDTALMAQMRGSKMADALDVGLALIELGDARAIDLAGYAATHAELAADRYRAIWILAEVLRVGRAVWEKPDVNPGEVLRRVAASEQDRIVQSMLCAALEDTGIDAGLAVPILEELMASAHAEDLVRRACRRTIAKKEAQAATLRVSTAPSATRAAP